MVITSGITTNRVINPATSNTAQKNSAKITKESEIVVPKCKGSGKSFTTDANLVSLLNPWGIIKIPNARRNSNREKAMLFSV
jgi:hypothetical protein